MDSVVGGDDETTDSRSNYSLEGAEKETGSVVV